MEACFRFGDIGITPIAAGRRRAHDCFRGAGVSDTPPWPACAMPRTQPSCRGRADDCMARMMRKSNHARSPSDAALLLCRASDCWFATHAIASPVTGGGLPSIYRPCPHRVLRGASSRRGASELPEASRSLATLAETLGSRPTGKRSEGSSWRLLHHKSDSAGAPAGRTSQAVGKHLPDHSRRRRRTEFIQSVPPS